MKLKCNRNFPDNARNKIEDNHFVFDSEDDFLDYVELTDGRFFQYVEDDELDEQLLLKAIKRNSACFLSIPPQLRTDNIYRCVEMTLKAFCDDALKYEDNCWDGLIYRDDCSVANIYWLNVSLANGVPDRQRQDNLLLKLISAGTHHIAYIPEDRINRSFKEAAWARAGASYENVLSGKISRKKCNAIVASRLYFLTKGLVPEHYQNIDMIEAILSNYCPRYTLDKIPGRFHSKDLYEYAVKVDSDNFRFVPDQFKTCEMCMDSLKYDLGNLKYVPDVIEKYEQICLNALQSGGCSPSVLECISPRCSRYYEFCMMVMSRLNRSFCGKLDIPDEIWTEELCATGLKRAPGLFMGLPDRFRTSEYAELAYFSANPKKRDLVMYAEDCITEKMCLDAVDSNPRQLKNVPPRLMTVELLAKATAVMQISGIRWERFNTETILKFIKYFFHLPPNTAILAQLSKKQWKELDEQDAIRKPILKIYRERLADKSLKQETNLT